MIQSSHYFPKRDIRFSSDPILLLACHLNPQSLKTALDEDGSVIFIGNALHLRSADSKRGATRYVKDTGIQDMHD